MSYDQEWSDDEMRSYFTRLGMQEPTSMRADPVRQERWRFMTEGLLHDLEYHCARNGRKSGVPVEVLEVARCQLEQLLENTLVLTCTSLKDKGLLRKSPKVILEEIDKSSVAPFVRMALPLIRRVFPKIFAKGLVNIQTMTQPTGYIFYMDTLYGTDKAPTKAGDRVDLKLNPYYAGGERTLELTAAAAQTVIDLADGGTSEQRLWINGVEQIPNGVNFQILAGAGPDGVDRVLLTAALVGGEAVTVTYANYSEGMIARDIDVDMKRDQIEAKDWALRAVTTVQALQDFTSVQGISAEAELTAAISDELEREIDHFILMELLRSAKGGNVTWDSTGFLPGDDNTFFRKKYRATLYEALVGAGNLIFGKRYTMPTWVVGGIGAIERLEKLEQFTITPDAGDPESANIDRIYEGVLTGRIKVYKAPRFPNNKLLLGYKGTSSYHSGATFAPYIPFYSTDMIPDPSINFKLRKGVLSRNGFKVTIPECYATVTIV